jgi:predicted ATPase/DNA-binding CsgD family transcriptional regulator
MSVNNLPSQPTSFIGREKELAEVAALLADPNCRLLTLVGAGGMGKTRLAIQAAADQHPHFADGIYFVPLAPVSSPHLLPAAIAEALQISFFRSEDPRIQIVRYLSQKHLLLVMDNFEHLLDGARLLAELLQAAPNLKILVTSRERLNLQEEWLLSLDGLSYPTASFADALENYSAIQLFIQRARQVKTHFSLDENAVAVLSICRHVEGMPLGLELAASWLHRMSCQQIVAQMTHNPDFLTTSLRNVPERHRSLRLVFEQSWNLLSDEEQKVLTDLSGFRGGFDLQAAEYVASASLTILARLADKSLIRLNVDGRYDIHELLRQYAAEKLMHRDSADHPALRHLKYFANLVEEGEIYLFGREQVAWFDRLEIEFNNLRAALAWSIGNSEAEVGLRLASALCWFFTERGHAVEGLEWMERLLPLTPNAPPSLRAKALHSAGALAGHSNGNPTVRQYYEQALALSRQTNDRWNIAWTLCHLAFYQNKMYDTSQAAEMLDESLELFRELKDPLGLGHTLIRRVYIALFQEDYTHARVLLDEALPIAREAGDNIIMGWVFNNQGRIAWNIDDVLAQAKTYFEASVTHFRQARFLGGMCETLVLLAGAEDALGNPERARALYVEALTVLWAKTKYPVHHILAGLAHLAIPQRRFRYAATLLAAVDFNPLFHFIRLAPKMIYYESDASALRNQLDPSTFAEAWAAGRAMTRDQAIAYALENSPLPSETLSSIDTTDQPLTDRELEILRLIADGLNSREIAQKLVLSVGTIRWYLKLIYSKLDAHSRSEALARAKSLNILT